MNRAKTKHISNFTDGILAFPNQFLAFLQLNIEQIAFRGVVQIHFKQGLQRGTGHKKLVTNLLDGNRFCYLFFHVCQNLLKQIASSKVINAESYHL